MIWFKDKKHNCKKACIATRDSMFYEVVNDSLRYGNKIGLDRIKSGPTKAYDWKYQKHSLKCFPWGQNQLMKKLYMNLLADESSQERVDWREFTPTINRYLNNDQQIAAERVYESLPFNFIINVWDLNNKGEKCEKIIIKSKDNSIFSRPWTHIRFKNKDFSKSLARFIEAIYSNDMSTENRIPYIVIQNGDKYELKLINMYPSEAVYRINSVFGRLKTLYHYEELKSIPDFQKLSQLKSILGLGRKLNKYLEGRIKYNHIVLYRLHHLSGIWSFLME